MDDFDDFSLITQLARRELIHVLESIPGTKELVVEASLTRPLDKIASMSLLEQHGAPRVHKLYMDRAVFWDPHLEFRVFIVRASIPVMRKIAELIKADPERRYSVICVGRRLAYCELELERHGVLGNVDFFELNLSIIPLESDLFSLELPQFSPDTSQSATQPLAKTLWQLQSLYGSIPTTYCVGKLAEETEKLARSISSELGEPSASADQPISHLLIFDRNADLVSSLLTGFTYESMLNDVFEYSCGKITFGEAVENKMKQKSSAKSRLVALNNSDAIFSAVRNKHMTAVFPFLSSKAKVLQSGFDKASNLNKVEEMKSFVSNELKALKDQHMQLELHICACEVVLETNKGANERFPIEHAIVQGTIDTEDLMSFFETWICRQQSPWQVLQMATLWSVCENGIPSAEFQQLRSCFLRAYGYDYLPALHQLQVRGLLVERTPAVALSVLNRPVSIGKDHNPITFRNTAKALKLLTNDEKPTNEADKTAERQRCSYVFSDAYTPVVIRVLENVVLDGWQVAKLEKALSPVFCTNPTPPKPDARLRKVSVNALNYLVYYSIVFRQFW
ncbi:vacuolar protein sorting-associated protein 33B-like protein [Aphelenchoides avenae]|nr:vacuolar protein sorting-associated protein 33B-like protein [Aphelenchus avenae]